MNLMILPRYGRSGSSSRYRFYNYLPHLEREFFRFRIHELLNDNYVSNLYSGGSMSPLYVAWSYGAVSRSSSHLSIAILYGWKERHFPFSQVGLGRHY